MFSAGMAGQNLHARRICSRTVRVAFVIQKNAQQSKQNFRYIIIGDYTVHNVVLCVNSIDFMRTGQMTTLLSSPPTGWVSLILAKYLWLISAAAECVCVCALCDSFEMLENLLFAVPNKPHSINW